LTFKATAGDGCGGSGFQTRQCRSRDESSGKTREEEQQGSTEGIRKDARKQRERKIDAQEILLRDQRIDNVSLCVYTSHSPLPVSLFTSVARFAEITITGTKYFQTKKKKGLSRFADLSKRVSEREKMVE
jgi:hypothetical protein